MRYLNSADTRQALPMPDAIRAMEHAFSAEAETPMRTMVGSSLVMPGRLEEVIAVKVVSTVPGNPAGLVVVFGPDGSLLASAHENRTIRLWSLDENAKVPPRRGQVRSDSHQDGVRNICLRSAASHRSGQAKFLPAASKSEIFGRH